MGDTPKFKRVTDLDPNVWYHISEERVDKYEYEKWTSSFQLRNSETGELGVLPSNDHRWQFQPVGKGQYAMRCSATGIFKQLSVCYVPSEIADGKTQPCLVTSHGGDEQKWEVADWGLEGNSTYRFTNVKNGTKYWMDVHRGNPPFMSPNIDTKIYQPAQRWLMTSASLVNDGDFSITFTNPPSTSTAPASTTDEPTTTTTDPSTSETTTQTADHNSPTNADPDTSTGSNGKSSGPSVGLAAGVGVGVGVGVILLALLAFLLWRRRQRARAGQQPPTELSNSPYQPHQKPAYGWSSPPGSAQQHLQPSVQEYYAKQPGQTHELGESRNHPHELPSKTATYELNS